LEPFDGDEILRALARDGLAEGLRLGPRALKALRDRALEQPCEAPLHPLSIAARGVDPIVAAYAESGTWGEIATLAESLEPLALRFLGPRSTFLGSRVWWSFPASARPDEELQAGRRFHFDLYAWRAMAAFFYLTDVGSEAGPHLCVAGTHRRKALRHRFSLRRWREDEEIDRAYGGDRIRTVLGAAGTGFLEDPTCFHKSALPSARPRLILELLWGSGDFLAPGFSRLTDARGRARA
jgi:hypothetical protein